MNSSCYTFDFQGASPPALGETPNGWRFTFYFVWTVTRVNCSLVGLALFFFLFLFSLHLHDACNLDGSVSRKAKGKPMDVGSTKVRYFVKLQSCRKCYLTILQDV